MKTDSQLQRDVVDELEFDPSIDHTGIGVAAERGVVSLFGFVPNYAQKMAAEKAVRRVAGVTAIAEELKVRFSWAPKTADSEIAGRIVDIFSWDAIIPDDDLTVKVEDGWVTLAGAVDWFYQADAARAAAGKIGGVTGVTNLIEIRRKPSAGDVRQHISDAIRRSADVDASRITVLADGGKIILGGEVKAWHEREVAEHAAWAVPGVTRVEDHIVLAV